MLKRCTLLDCTELGSDAPLDNHTSHATHEALGFAETAKRCIS